MARQTAGEDAILDLGAWAARPGATTLELVHRSGALRLGVAEGRVVTVEGPSGADVARHLGRPVRGDGEPLQLTRDLAEEAGFSPTRGAGAVKSCVEASLRTWLLDPERRLGELGEAPTDACGLSFSLPHALVEVVLSDGGSELPSAILPDPEQPLVRGRRFLDRYASLQLTEDADLVAAGVDGHRGVRAIAASRGFPDGETHRLLAALTVAGIVVPDDGGKDRPAGEPSPEPTPPAPEPTPAPRPPAPERAVTPSPPAAVPVRRKVSPWWIFAAAALALLLLLALVWWRSADDDSAGVGTTAAWAVVVDEACHPELERILKAAEMSRGDELRPVRVGDGEDRCWRLVWGRFATADEADQALQRLPQEVVAEGFDPFAMEVGPGQEVPMP